MSHLEQILVSAPPGNVIQDELIRVLENKVDALSSVQEKLIYENDELRETIEAYENLVQENENLKFANGQYQIELKERDNDEEKYSQQVSLIAGIDY